MTIPDTPPDARRGAGTILVQALWFGLATGIAEVGLLAVRKYLLHRFLFVSMDAVWMAPAADAVLFLAAGILLWVINRVLPSRWRIAPAGVFTALGVFTLLLMYGPLSRLAAGIIALGIGVQAARILSSREAVYLRLVRRSVAVLLAIVVLGGVGVRAAMALAGRTQGSGRQAAGAPNVLLIVLDTVRAWSLGLYGYSRPTTPELDRWLADGTRFQTALSTAPWTLPSHATMFTGRWPHELSAGWLSPLDDAQPTLAEVLRSRGYATAGFVANTTYCSYESGLARGFAHYEDYPVTVYQVLFSSQLGRYLAGSRFTRRKLLRVSAEDINRRVLSWLDHRPGGRPFFVFLNYLDAHNPYQPPAPFDTLFSDSGAERYIEALRDDTPAREWTPEGRRAAVDKYDESLAYLDAQLGHLFAELERRGLWDSTLVVVTSDHGEEFGEHNVFFHGNSLFRPALEVPLMIRYPGHVPAGQVVRTPVSLKDLAATVLDLSGSDPRLPGRSLRRFWADSSSGVGDTLLMELGYSPRLPRGTPIARGPMKSVVVDGFRLIRNGDGREELYDFVADTMETRDLAADPAWAEALSHARGALQAVAPRVGGPRP